MKILFTVDETYPYAGGSTRVVAQLTEALASQGHEVAVVCPRRSTGTGKEKLICCRTLRLPFIPEGSLFYDQPAYREAVAFAPDVVHSHGERGSLLLAQSIAKNRGARHVHTLHADYAALRRYYLGWYVLSISFYLLSCYALSRKREPRPVHSNLGFNILSKAFWDRLDYHNLARFALSANITATPSHYIKEKLAFLDSDRLRLLPVGHSEMLAKEKRPEKQDATVEILCVGRLCREKRSLTLLHAFTRALHAGRPLRLHIVGNGPQLCLLKRVAASLGISQQVIFHGQVNSRDELAQLYAASDIFVLPSYHFETQGLVLLEAAAHGLPIVYCDGRLKVGVSPENALLTAHDEASLARGIMTLAENPARRQAMATASVRIAGHHHFDNTVRAYLSLYRNM